MLTRRHFTPVAVASGLAAMTARLQAAEGERSAPEVCVYTEHFQQLSIPEVCRVSQEIGINGLELTVRPGGHIISVRCERLHPADNRRLRISPKNLCEAPGVLTSRWDATPLRQHREPVERTSTSGSAEVHHV